MSVHKKLMQARVELQGRKLNKSGNNKFAGYQYFELGDFMPAVNEIFNGLGLCGVISFGSDLATLTICDVEGGEPIVITSPMSEANLKGCHPIQNLGAVETYTRRYLWVTALEIVEHDALDATTGQGKPNHSAKSIGQDVMESMNEEEKAWLEDIASRARVYMTREGALAAVEYIRSQNLHADERTALNALFDSKERAAMKKAVESEKVAA